MADPDKVTPADEPDTSATTGEPEIDHTEADLGADLADVGDTEVELDGVSDGDGEVDGVGEGDRELVAAGGVTAARSAADPGSGTRAGRQPRSKKDKATPKQKRSAAEQGRTGPVTFVKQSVAELRKVVYPTRQQLANYFVVVLIFVLFVIAYVSLLDLGIGALVFRIFA